MKSLIEYINEWKEDLGNQVILIMGTPGCGKTYWMDHHARKFFRSQGLTLNGKELDIDHTLKYFQIIDFPNFCRRVINYKNTTISNPKTGKSVHNNDQAWKTFIDTEKERYTNLNKSNGGLDTNVPDLDKIDFEFVSPWMTRYDNAKDDMKKEVFDKFVKAMYNEYFNDVFASDFSVRGDAKELYNINMLVKMASKGDVYVAISGAKYNHIEEVAKLCKENNSICRIVYLNGSLDKAVYQDAKRERSGGKDFVISYANKIENTWKELTDPSSEKYFKNNNIYCMYELIDTNADDIESHPAWKLEKVYK